MIVSTRGVNFKFSTGEKVLCYEPDPTKAKVLYESKVLNLVATRDHRGRKVCEYLIHFFGWNSSWDRYVKEEFILPYTEENKELQAKLAEEAALTLKHKKKHKLPPLIRGTLSKILCAKNNAQESKPKTPPISSSDTESSEDDAEKEVIIEIPNSLKTVLEEDCSLITEKNKFVKIPCETNVITILEDFVKHYASILLSATPPKNVTNSQKLIPTVVRNKINLCKETMDGIRVFFDFTLPHLLLYRQEKKQFYTVGTTCAPIFDPDSFKIEPTEDVSPAIKTEVMDDILHEYETAKQQRSNLLIPKSEFETVIQNEIKLQRPNNLRNPANKVVLSDAETVVLEAKVKLEQKPHLQAPKTKVSKKTKSHSKSKSTRILRSNDRQKGQTEKDAPSLKPSSATTESNSSLIFIPPPPIEQMLSPRLTRKSASSCISNIHQTASSSSSLHHLLDKSLPNSPTTCVPKMEPTFPLPPNYFDSSNSSTQSTISNALLEAQRYRERYNNKLLKEIMSWHMCPLSVYEQVPAAPSLIYGAHHLLRLFVKLPLLMSKMTIKQKKLEIVLIIIENFLIYLAERKNELFTFAVYMDSDDVFPIVPIGAVK